MPNYIDILGEFFPTSQASIAPIANRDKVVAGDGSAGDNFGRYMAISHDGSTAIVGSNHDADNGSNSGSSYILVRNGGEWTQQAKLLPADGAANDNFGASVSISADGNTALIGTLSGNKAYIFTRSGSVWTEQQKLTPSSGGSKFGNAVAISEDGIYCIIGAYAQTTYTGEAFIFKNIAGTWTEQQKLTASDSSTLSFFGIAVAISANGSTAIVTATGKNSNAGAAYAFTRSGEVYTEQQKLSASDSTSGYQFGASVSIAGDGDTLVVGSSAQITYTGAAYAFTRSGGVYTEQQKLTASDSTTNHYFGYSLDISSLGDKLIIGAYGDNSSTGAAYIFTLDGTWSEIEKMIPSDGAANDLYGLTVSISLDGYITGAGAYQDDDLGSASGSSYFTTTKYGNPEVYADLIWKTSVISKEDLDVFIGTEGTTIPISIDTIINNCQNGQVLNFDSVTGAWKNKDSSLLPNTYNTITSSYTIDNKSIILVDTTNIAVSVTLPLASTVAGNIFYVKWYDGIEANSLTIIPTGNDLIDGETSQIYGEIGDSLQFFSDGINWYIL